MAKTTLSLRFLSGRFEARAEHTRFGVVLRVRVHGAGDRHVCAQCHNKHTRTHNTHTHTHGAQQQLAAWCGKRGV